MTSAQPDTTSAPLVPVSSTLALVHYLERQGVLNGPRVEQLTGLTMSELTGQAILCWQPDMAEHYYRQDMDRILAAAITRARHFIHPGIRAEWVEIAQPAPVYADEYEKLLGGCFHNRWQPRRLTLPAWTGTSPAEYRARHLSTPESDNQKPIAGNGER